MLKPAIFYQEELNELFKQTWRQEKYKFYNTFSYTVFDNVYNTNEWTELQNACIVDGRVIGYIEATLDRDINSAHTLVAVNFEEPSMTFGKDLLSFLRHIKILGIRKLNFDVVTGNPMESRYDRLVEKMGGRVVGIKKDHAKLYDGKLYDLKMYEVFF